MSVDTSDGLFLEPKVRKQSAIRVTYTPINKNISKLDTHLLTNTSSLLEVTNKPLQPNKQKPQNNKSIIASENSQRRVVNAFQNHPPSIRVQSTDGAASVTTSSKTQPFKLTPVLPPTKNKVVNLKSSSLCDKSNTDPNQQVTLVSSTNKPVPVMYTLGKNASALLEDEAIISIGTTVSLTNSSEKISNAAIGELNDS